MIRRGGMLYAYFQFPPELIGRFMRGVSRILEDAFWGRRIERDGVEAKPVCVFDRRGGRVEIEFAAEREVFFSESEGGSILYRVCRSVVKIVYAHQKPAVEYGGIY